MPLVWLWFRAFVWTLLLEQAAAGLALRTSVKRARRISIIAVANLASHPALWLVFPELGAAFGWPHALTLFVSEAWGVQPRGVDLLALSRRVALAPGGDDFRRRQWAVVRRRLRAARAGLGLSRDVERRRAATLAQRLRHFEKRAPALHPSRLLKQIRLTLGAHP